MGRDMRPLRRQRAVGEKPRSAGHICCGTVFQPPARGAKTNPAAGLEPVNPCADGGRAGASRRPSCALHWGSAGLLSGAAAVAKAPSLRVGRRDGLLGGGPPATPSQPSLRTQAPNSSTRGKSVSERSPNSSRNFGVVRYIRGRPGKSARPAGSMSSPSRSFSTA